MTGKKQYQDLANKLISRYRPDVRVTKMYGISMLTMRGRAFAGLNRDDMVFRLDGVALTKASKLKGAKPFEPADKRDMPGWVQVPVVHVGHWRGMAEEALVRAGESN